MKQIAIRRLLAAGILLLGVMGLGVLAPSTVEAGAASSEAACTAIGGTWSGDTCTTDGPTLDDTVSNVVNIFSIIVGLIAVFMIIFGGFKYIKSRGDSGELTAARNTIIYAVIGLAVAALAQALVRFVINNAD